VTNRLVRLLVHICVRVCACVQVSVRVSERACVCVSMHASCACVHAWRYCAWSPVVSHTCQSHHIHSSDVTVLTQTPSTPRSLGQAKFRHLLMFHTISKIHLLLHQRKAKAIVTKSILANRWSGSWKMEVLDLFWNVHWHVDEIHVTVAAVVS
jgi:hypothetical protein